MLHGGRNSGRAVMRTNKGASAPRSAIPRKTSSVVGSLLGGYVGAAEALAAPIGDWMQRRALQKLRTTPFGPGVRRVLQPTLKFFDQARFTQTWLAHDQHQLPLALPRPLPAPRQHGDFLVTAHKWCQMALPGTASSAARAPAGITS